MEYDVLRSPFFIFYDYEKPAHNGGGWRGSVLPADGPQAPLTYQQGSIRSPSNTAKVNIR